jgi:hypothetical protein
MLDATAGDPYRYMPTVSVASLVHRVVIGRRR